MLIDDGDGAIHLVIHNGCDGVELVYNYKIIDGTLIIKDLHVEKLGGNIRTKDMARALGERAGVNKVEIHGADRTNGADPGHTPRKITIEIE